MDMSAEAHSRTLQTDSEPVSWSIVERHLDEELPFRDSDSEKEEEETYYFILSRPAPGGDIFQATRVGDNERLRHLLQLTSTHINKRDAWDCPPLYYACLAGHLEAAEILLEAGATCNEHTFDGDRIHYAALNIQIRSLLRRYEARPPPLSPLAAALRQACSFCANPEAADEAPRPSHFDLVFLINGERFEVHRAILAARSSFCRKMLKGAWRPDKADDPKEVTVGAGHGQLSKEALRAVITFLYTDRLDVEAGEVQSAQKFARKLRLQDLASTLAAEDARHAIRFKRARSHAAKRLVVPPGALPPDVQLAAQLAGLLALSISIASSGNLEPAEDFADVVLVVQGRPFRCHSFILASRAEYFSALLQRSRAQQEDGQLPVIQHGDISPEVFETVLTFIYTHELPQFEKHHFAISHVESLLYAADMYLLDAMKRSVAEAVLYDIEQGMRVGHQPALEHLVRLLLAADRSNVSVLRDACLVAVAKRFDVLAADGASSRDCAVLSHFIQSVSPQDWSEIDDLLQFASTADAAAVAGASGGNIEGGGISGIGAGTLLQDLREAYLEHVVVAGDLGRDEKAALFDQHLKQIAAQGRQAP